MDKKIKVTRGWGLFEGFLAKKRAKEANKLIVRRQKTGKILDIGCGSYPYFLLSTNFAEKYGIDPSLNDISIKGVNLEKLDVVKQKLPFNDDFFDAVTMLAVFEHIKHKDLVLLIREIHRVLKKSGILIITTPAPWSDKLLHQLAKLKLISSEEIHEHKHNHPREKIADIIRSGGFNKANIKSGFFELKMNMWFLAEK